MRAACRSSFAACAASRSGATASGASHADAIEPFTMIEIHVHHHYDSPRDSAQLRRIEDLLTLLGERFVHTSQELLDAVNRVKTDIAAKIRDLSDQLGNAGGNQTAVDTATDSLNALADDLEKPATTPPVTTDTGSSGSTTTTDPNAPPTT
jgi:hypothetical protein